MDPAAPSQPVQEVGQQAHAEDPRISSEWAPSAAELANSHLPVIPLMEHTALPPHVPYLMPDISNLMMVMTTAMAQGPGSRANSLAQTFHPLVNMAIAMQLKALHNPPMDLESLNPADYGDAGRVGVDGSGGMYLPPLLALTGTYNAYNTSTHNTQPPRNNAALQEPSEWQTNTGEAAVWAVGEVKVENGALVAPVAAPVVAPPPPPVQAVQAPGQRSHRRRKANSRLAEYVDADDIL